MFSNYSSGKLSIKQLAGIRLFSGFSKEDFKVLSDIIKVQKFVSGSHIIQEGEDAQKLYFILDGSAKVYKKNYKGKDELIGNLQTEQCFGEMAFIDRGKRSATVIAETDIVVAEFFWSEFCSKFIEKPFIITQMFKNLAYNLSLRLRRANAVYSYLVQNVSV